MEIKDINVWDCPIVRVVSNANGLIEIQCYDSMEQIHPTFTCCIYGPDDKVPQVEVFVEKRYETPRR